MKEECFKRKVTSNSMAYSPYIAVTEEIFLNNLHNYVTLCVVTRAIECGHIGYFLQAKNDNIDTRVQDLITQFFKDGTFADYFLIKALEMIYIMGGRFSDNKYIRNCIKESIYTLKWMTGVHIHPSGYVYRQDVDSFKIDWSISDSIVTNGDMLCNFLSKECTTMKDLLSIMFVAKMGLELNSGAMSSLLSCSIMKHSDYYDTDDNFKETAMDCALKLDLSVQRFVIETLSDERMIKAIDSLLNSRNGLTWVYIHCLLTDMTDFSRISKKILLGDETQEEKDNERILNAVVDDIEDFAYEIRTIKRLEEKQL